jgi:CheY-like chemotaxis protein
MITDVHLVGSGREAIAVAKREGADAILSSMHLSDMTGLDLARLLLSDGGCEKLGFVLATSEADLAEAASLLPKITRVTMVSKPFDLNRLAQALGQTMS